MVVVSAPAVVVDSVADVVSVEPVVASVVGALDDVATAAVVVEAPLAAAPLLPQEVQQ